MNLEEARVEDVDRIHLIQEREQWMTHVRTVMNGYHKDREIS
jgi:hypothetical protein